METQQDRKCCDDVLLKALQTTSVVGFFQVPPLSTGSRVVHRVPGGPQSPRWSKGSKWVVVVYRVPGGGLQGPRLPKGSKGVVVVYRVPGQSGAEGRGATGPRDPALGPRARPLTNVFLFLRSHAHAS
ncbi:unnamed protein product [Arctogadus glacialis]